MQLPEQTYRENRTPKESPKQQKKCKVLQARFY